MTCGRGPVLPVVGLVLVGALGSGIVAAPASAADSAAVTTSPESYLFTVDAAFGSTRPLARGPQAEERFTLTLTGVDPVTKFADRPFRDASVISPGALDANWNA